MNSINKTARITGLLYILMIPFAIFGIMYIPSTLFVPGDAVTTANNIISSAPLFRLGIVSALFVQIGHIIIVLLLYSILKPVNKNHALLMVIFMLVSVPITMFNELNNFAALFLSQGVVDGTALTGSQSQGLVPLFLDLHAYGILIASIFWGLWLFPMGYLVFKSDFLPRLPGVLLMVACCGYLIDSICRLLLPIYDGTIFATIVGITLYGELVFPFWLLIKGINVEKWKKMTE
ncbi:MAG: DUF4386 domain-containing protein [Spirochaetales bacterium]|nr:DUF4386 domain-containing protein [Spirochaetales bacterium]